MALQILTNISSDKKQGDHRGINVSPMNPEADLSLWHVNLYGSELKLLLLL
jgi:hypothetical protein